MTFYKDDFNKGCGYNHGYNHGHHHNHHRCDCECRCCLCKAVMTFLDFLKRIVSK
jgi:hypothetical protein